MRRRFRSILLVIAPAAACLALLGGGVASASAVAGPATASGGWTIQSTYAPPPQVANKKYITLNDVSCSAANACLTIGMAGTKLLSETWNGTTWTPLLSAFPSGGGQLSDVACSAAAACTAVGFGFVNGTTEVNLAEQWNGTSWQQQTVPAPSGVEAPALSGVSCPGAESCVAVGDDEPTGQTDVDDPMAVAWDGTSWSVQATPSTGYSDSGLADVSCPTATDCIAVGESSNSILTEGIVLAEQWNGTSWTIQKTPTLPASDQAALYSVSCPAVNACMATGSYKKDGVLTTLIERWNGTRWAIEPALPTGLGIGRISCPSTISCTALGTDENSKGGEVTVAAHWNGKTWTVQHLPIPAGAEGHVISLHDISCPSTTACEVVGLFHAKPKTGRFRDKTIIEGN
jgi:hypothetical protein